jgi:hypothetical protein
MAAAGTPTSVERRPDYTKRHDHRSKPYRAFQNAGSDRRKEVRQDGKVDKARQTTAEDEAQKRQK